MIYKTSIKQLPKVPGIFAALGPGIVWMAFAQGSGELIWWPYLIAKYGLTFLAILIPAALLQFPLTYEIGRYTLYTGEGIWRGFVKLNRKYAFMMWLVMLVQFLWFGAFASAGGTALAALTDFPGEWTQRGQSLFWGYASMAMFLGILVSSKLVYRSIERIMWGIAVLTVVGLIAACTHPDVVSVLPSFAKGIVGVRGEMPRPWEAGDATILITAITFIGLGGFFSLFYSYWVKEKGFGMAHYAAHVIGLLRGIVPGGVGSEEMSMEPSREDHKRLSGWLRILKIDVGVGVGGNILTTLLMCLLAYAVLFPKGIIPQEWNIAVVQAKFFELRWGSVGTMLFYVVAAAFLVDTWLTSIDALSRVNSDVVMSLFKGAKRKSLSWWYYFFLFIFAAVTAITMPLAQPGVLILITGVLSFIGIILYAVPLWILNYRFLPKHLPDFSRPSRAAQMLMAAVIAIYAVLLIAFVWVRFF